MSTRASAYAKDRSYFLLLLQVQIGELRSNPDSRAQVVTRLRELFRMVPRCLENAHLLGDTLFYESCCTFQTACHSAIPILRKDEDPISAYMAADQLERSVSWENPQ
ncbi:uncharacterized protein N7479_005874 [Penicillium vulpinum]|uniref:Uncharacterized protein n=1 Tax=Penicillium vulpinum TaxID=29845 RepID=A0A1V6SEG1_9EURO|nr:uncharacterized protein N7479_005874 [Penicillium vulpinum]KAJ5958724.1 hypothetical protein N7479_005874 [Penicillium vulpinum]OQE12385.1 hypothetical protein PENVUL_c001G07434 [Penicillium vulpinum]